MTPIEFAQNLAKSDTFEDRALGVALIARGLSDDTEDRAGWPLEASIIAAIRHLGLESTPLLIAKAASLAPTISDAMMNRHG